MILASHSYGVSIAVNHAHPVLMYIYIYIRIYVYVDKSKWVLAAITAKPLMVVCYPL